MFEQNSPFSSTKHLHTIKNITSWVRVRSSDLFGHKADMLPATPPSPCAAQAKPRCVVASALRGAACASARPWARMPRFYQGRVAS